MSARRETAWRLARREPVFFVILFGFGLLVYRSSLANAFIADDYGWIEPMSFGRLLGYFASSWGHGPYFRPIIRVLFFLDEVLFGDHPLGWRIVNVLIHAFNGWLIARIAAHFTGNRLAARAAALLFIAYPAAVENVAWISGATHSLCALFILGSLCALYASLGEMDVVRRLRLALVSGAGALAAIWTYDVAVVLPAMQVIVLLLRRMERRGEPMHLLGWVVALGGWAAGNAWRVFMLPAELDFVYPSPLVGLSKHFIAYWELLLVTVQLRTLAAVVLGMAVMLVVSRAASDTPRLVRRLVIVVSLAAVSFAPFVMFNGESYRLYYLTLVFWMLALSLMLDYVGRVAGAQRLAFGAGCAGLLLVSVYETDKMCREWRVVSDTTRMMLEQVHAALPQWPDRTDLVFVAMGNHYRRAIAYDAGYLAVMVLRTFPAAGGQIFMADNLDALPPESDGRHRIVFEWLGFATGRGEPAGVRVAMVPNR
ncbi:MAG: hypothetical protein WDO24_19110 [Pseudomonadota bacterium]